MKKIETITFKEVTYIKFLNKLVTREPSKKDLDLDTFYIYNDEELKRKFIIKYKFTYPSLDKNLKTYDPERGIKASRYSTMFIFSILKDYPIDEEITDTKIIFDGFRNVIDDRDYIYDIPLVNEIWHDDNFIISHINTRICFYKGKTIDEFNLYYDIIKDNSTNIENYYGEGHKND